MFGTNNQSINQYKKVSIESGIDAANPIELIVMLYDGAIVACRTAIPFMRNKDRANQSQYIYKAMKIIQSGLRMSLDGSANGEMAGNLDALYTYMTNQLIKANIEDKEELLEEVIRLLGELRGAWHQISKTDAANKASGKKVVDVNAINYLEKV